MMDEHFEWNGADLDADAVGRLISLLPAAEDKRSKAVPMHGVAG